MTTLVHPPQGDLVGPPVRALMRTYADGCVIPSHRHERGQLVYAVSGVMKMSAQDHIWLIPPQRALWVPPGINHGLKAMGKVELRTVFIHPDAIPSNFPQCPTIAEVTPLLRELLVRAAFIPDNYKPDECDGLIMMLILYDVSWQANAPWRLPMGRDPRLSRVCMDILDRPDDNRTLGEWGKSTGASARTLARLFQQETGLSFLRWRQQARVALSLPRLAAGDPVAVIAADLGYETPAAFSAMFLRFTGRSPSRYFLSDWA